MVSVSVDSLQSSDGSVELNELKPPQSSHARPLSLVGLVGSVSIESTDATSPKQPPAQGISNNNGRTASSSSSKEMLKTINEDIDRLRELKASRSNNPSSNNSLDGSFQRGSTPLLVDHVLLGEEDPEHETPVNTSDELPSHSVCVDSGLVMDEESYCQSNSDTVSSTETVSSQTSSQKALDSSKPPSTREKLIAQANSTALSRSSSGSKINPEAVESLPSIKVETNASAFRPKLCKLASTEISIDADSPTSQPNTSSVSSMPFVAYNKNLQSTRAITKSASTDGTFGLGNQSQLEPLLSSVSVPLRTKLKRLSNLYDCDDGTDFKIKAEEPSGPYDVFKPPNKPLHTRSK